MKRLLALLLAAVMAIGTAACGEQKPEEMEPEHPAHTEEGTEARYVWGEHVNISMWMPEGWQWEEDDHNQFGRTAWNDDLPDTVGFDFWKTDTPELRFSFRCWTHIFAMCGTGVDFRKVTGIHKLNVATEPSDDGTVYVHIIFNDVPGDYVVSGQIPAALWEEYGSYVIGMVDEAAVGEGCMSFDEAFSLAQGAVAEGWNGEPVSHYDVQTGTWTVIFNAGSNDYRVDVDENGMVIVPYPGKE